MANNASTNKILLTVAIFGSAQVGKTSLIERLYPTCPYCKMEKIFRKISKDVEQENGEKAQKEEIARETASKETAWNIKDKKAVQSLKFICRHIIITNNIHFTQIGLPIELEDYISEGRHLFCGKCSKGIVQYLDRTEKFVYFEKEMPKSPTQENLDDEDDDTNSQYPSSNSNMITICGFRILDSPPWNMALQASELLKVVINASKGYIFVFDLSKKSSFEELDSIINKVKELSITSTKV